MKLFIFKVGKEMLCPRQPSETDPSGFNLLLELLRGDHWSENSKIQNFEDSTDTFSIKC
jgi:hypothetical protein